MKILHLSDIHLGHWPAGFGWLLDKRVLGVFTQHVRRRPRQDMSCVDRLASLTERLRPDVIVCTGDLGSIGEPSEFDHALSVLKPLAQQYGERFLYVPGNHDAYVGHRRNVDALSRTCLELNGFGLEAFPVERKVENVRFIMVNGAVPMPPWKSAGKVAEAAMKRLEEMLCRKREQGERRVMVCHFPLYAYDGGGLGVRRRISVERELRKWAEEGRFDALLCGHLHRPFIWRHGDWTQVCAGALTLSKRVAVVDVGKETNCEFIEI